MRLGHLSGPDGPELFVEADDRRLAVRDLVPEAPPTLDALIRDGADWPARISTALSDGRSGEIDESADLMSPLLEPRSIIAIGLNYLDHCREFGTEPPRSPIIFTKLGSSVCGPGGQVEWPRSITSAVDWEAELGVVIGSAASAGGVDRALDHVFGYTVVNDGTARELQQDEAQWVRAKSLDPFCPIGPVVVTADELSDPQSLAIRS